MTKDERLFQKLLAVMSSEQMTNSEAYTLAVNLMAFVLFNGSNGGLPAPSLVETLMRDVTRSMEANAPQPAPQEKPH